MRFDPDLVPADAHKLLNRFIAITGWDVWKKRFSDLDQQCSTSIFLDDFISDSLEIEMALQRAARYRNQRHTWPVLRPDNIDSSTYKMLGFVSITARVHQRLSPQGRARLKGMLRNGLKDDRGLSSVAFEMEVAGYLLRHGFDVKFNDLEGGGFDFLARRDGAELEVECKHVSADVGRKIHRHRMAQFGSYFTRSWSGRLDDGGHFLSVTLPDRLNGEDGAMRAIADKVTLALETKLDDLRPTPCTVQYQPFSLAGTPLEDAARSIDVKSVHRFTEARFAKQNPNLLIVHRPRKAALLVSVESRKPDKVLDGIYRQLKGGANQLSRNRPGVLCALLADITTPQLHNLAGAGSPTGLQIITSNLLNSKKRQHLHTIAYMALGDLTASSHHLGNRVERSIQAKGAAYSFKNRHHPSATDSRLDVFDLWNAPTTA